MNVNPPAEAADRPARRKKSVNPLRMIALALTIAAIVKELRLPKDERTWTGTIVGFVPYDFRKPTGERFKEAMWNPDGPVVVGRPFGVGWTVNLGALVGRAKAASAGS